MHAPPPAPTRRLISAAAYAGSVALAIFIAARGASALDYNWQWYRLPQFFGRFDGGEFIAGPLIKGLGVTIGISAAAAVLTAVIGLFIAMLGRAQLRSARGLARAYVEIVRSTPLLVQLYLLYFMLANVFHLDRATAGIVALAFFEGAFAAEIFRAGIEAIPAGQWDAARALGMRKLAIYRLVALPQSLPLILPPLANLFVSLLKHSSIVTIIAVADLTDQARNLISDTFMVFEIWLAVAAIYVTLASLLSLGISRWEKRLLSRIGIGKKQ